MIVVAIVGSIVGLIVALEIVVRRSGYPELRRQVRQAKRTPRANPAYALSEHFRVRLVERLVEWVRFHPAPNDPILGFAQEGILSPREILAAVQEGTDDGQLFVELVAGGLRYASFERILDSFLPGSK